MGTGGTAAGLLKGLAGSKELWAFSVLKLDCVLRDFQRLLDLYQISHNNFRVTDDRAFGGYGKFDYRLIQFIFDFRRDYGIALDPIYSGKAFYNIWTMIERGEIAAGVRLLLLHTGGLQGIVGFNQIHKLSLPSTSLDI